MGPMMAEPVPAEVIESLVSLSVTQKAGERSGFQLTFSISKNGLIQRVLLPNGFFEPIATRVQIIVSFGGTSKVLMDGLIARHELSMSNEPGKSTLTITGEDVSLAMNLIDMTGIPYPCMPPELRVITILGMFSMFGLVPEVLPAALPDVPNPLDKIPTHVGTGLAYIKSLAAAVGYTFYIEPISQGVNRAYWGPDIRWGSVQPALTVNSDGASNVESLSFSFDGMSGTLFYLMVQVPQAGFAIPVPIPPINMLRPPLALQPPIPYRLEKIDDTSKLGPISGPLVGLSKALQANDAVTAQGSLNVLQYGSILESRSLVDVRGAGLAYDGTYFVNSVTHTIKRGEYKQSFSLAREGLVPLSSRVQV
jgi:hypothetical protein